jgi:hypothetical protein
VEKVIELLSKVFDEKSFAAIALVGIVIVALWIVYKFFAEDTSKSAQKYYDLKVDLCREVSKVVALIATSNNADEIRKAAFHFEELYWGRLILVEDAKLESAMVKYRGLMPTAHEGIDADAVVGKIGTDRRDLRSGALNVSKACFNLLQPSWLKTLWASVRPARKRT